MGAAILSAINLSLYVTENVSDCEITLVESDSVVLVDDVVDDDISEELPNNFYESQNNTTIFSKEEEIQTNIRRNSSIKITVTRNNNKYVQIDKITNTSPLAKFIKIRKLEMTKRKYKRLLKSSMKTK